MVFPIGQIGLQRSRYVCMKSSTPRSEKKIGGPIMEKRIGDVSDRTKPRLRWRCLLRRFGHGLIVPDLSIRELKTPNLVHDGVFSRPIRIADSYRELNLSCRGARKFVCDITASSSTSS